MAFLTICITAFIAALLTLFSGFGLGSILLPPFAVFLPLETAIAAVAVVHLANNLFKLVLVGKFADRRLVLLFGIPGMAAAVGGALLLKALGKMAPLGVYHLGKSEYSLHPLNLVIGFLMIAFAFIDVLPFASRLAFDRRLLPIGGLISGFFGGLSGHQGAFRSAFLMRTGLSREAFIGTGVVCAVLIDFARLIVYTTKFLTQPLSAVYKGSAGLYVAAAIVSAFAGSYLGARLFRKVTLRVIQRIVAAMLVLLGLAVAAGLVSQG